MVKQEGSVAGRKQNGITGNDGSILWYHSLYSTFCVANKVKICDRFYINLKPRFVLWTRKLEAYGRRRRPKVGAGEWRGTRHEAAPVVLVVLVDAGKPTGAASTGWRWRMLVEPAEVLYQDGWLVSWVEVGVLGRVAGGLGIQLKWCNESGDI